MIIGQSQGGAIAPVLIHGDQDSIVPLSEGREIFELAAEPKEFWELRNGWRTDALLHRDAIRELLEERLISWCE